MTSPVRPTTWIRPDTAPAGVDLLLASEVGQVTGSFKFRAAYELVSSVPNPRILTASSGNFGMALAAACQLLGKTCTVVMPETSAAVKVAGVLTHGATIIMIDTTTVSRAEKVAELAAADPEAYVASAYDDFHVIAGNASLGDELAYRTPDYVIAPVGGGGLTAGILLGLKRSGQPTAVMGAEPELANDAARSFRAGELIANQTEPLTIADGARTLSLGQLNWGVLQGGFADVLEVSEADIRAGVRWLAAHAGLRAEPTGALAVAAVLAHPYKFVNKRVVAVVSGGNVDADVYDAIMADVKHPV